MRMRIALSALCFLFLVGCGGGGDDPATPDPPADDTIAPAAIDDLHVAATSDTTMTVAWTAPGDDGDEGTATSYLVRHCGDPIDGTSWAACTPAAGVPAPALAGTGQSLTIRNPGGLILYVALRAVDDQGNESELSNVVHATFPAPTCIRQLTTTGTNTEPCLYDGIVTWVRGADGGEEIWRADLTDAIPHPVALTDNGGFKSHHSSQGFGRVVWQGRASESEDWEIWVYDPSKTPTVEVITANAVHDWYPSLAGDGDIVWMSGPSMYEHITYRNESAGTETIISDGCCPTAEYFSEEPAASDDGLVIWRSWRRTTGSTPSTWLWDEANRTLTDLSDEFGDTQPVRHSIQGGEVAYEHGVGPTQIAYWNGATCEIIANGYAPCLYEGRIAYSYWDGHDWEIHYWDGSQVIEITDNDTNDGSPTLFGSKLAWSGRPDGGTSQIYWIDLQ